MNINGHSQAKAWGNVFDFPLAGRTFKPRQVGLTMVIDKGMGLRETEDLLSLAGDYFDFWKLGFGTSAFYSEAMLRRKIALAHEHQVEIYPGGTFLEVAVSQNRLEEFYDRAVALGFTTVEISDGTIELPPDRRRQLVTAAKAFGLKVLTEVGKKDPNQKVIVEEMLGQVAADLAAGASLVIIEGRESGKGIGIYDKDGRIIRSELEELVAGLTDPGVVIWEAPLKDQQLELILRFGPNVSLGNVSPQEILALEALRVGLRGDTLRYTLPSGQKL